MLEINNLSIKYNKSMVVSDVSLQMKPGEIVGIVGESGSGKTTLIKAIMGILPENGDIVSGTIKFMGQEIQNQSEDVYRTLRGNDITMIFQHSASHMDPLVNIKGAFFEAVTVHQNMTKEKIRTLGKDIFHKLMFREGEGLMEKYPFELSGGMAQRVSIGLGLANNPRLILADEPTSALDVTVQKQVVETLMKIREEENCGILIVSHNIGVIATMADKVGVMYKGRLVEWGPKEQVLYSPSNEYTRKLIKAIPKLHKGGITNG